MEVRKILTSIVAIFALMFANVFAQEYFYMYKNGGVFRSVKIAEAGIDSITVRKKEVRIYDNSEGPGILTYTEYNASTLDSIAFSLYPSHKVSGYVDLGLSSGTLWATCNIGASTPEEYGDYYAWGETERKSVYSEENCKWYGFLTNELLSLGVVEEEVYDYYVGQEKIRDTTYHLTAEYDVATKNWGKDWRMPTSAETSELFYECDIKVDTLNGIAGYSFISRKNENSLFIPFAGAFPEWERNSTNTVACGSDFYIWTSSVIKESMFETDFEKARSWYCWSGMGNYPSPRYGGVSVRPVYIGKSR